MADVEIRDPIHGFIKCSPCEVRLINSFIFQRLRRIRQLALAYLVYPGALHTRFDHSLGVMHLASRLSDRVLSGNLEEQRLVRLAALLHDIGHGPFSHVSESALSVFYDRDKVRPKGTERIHEVLTCMLIEHSNELRKLISENDRECITGILQRKWGDSILGDIVSGPLDADKLDYLLRDSHFCGVKYGVYDLDRLLCTIRPTVMDDDSTLVVSADGVNSLEQFVLAKYYMSTQVYRHRVRLITDQMITRGIELGITEDNLAFLRRIYCFDGSEDHLIEWAKWDDDLLLNKICGDETPHGYAREIFQRLLRRQLYKQVFHQSLDTFSREVRREVSENFPYYRDTLESEIGRAIKVDPNQVIAHRYTIESVREQFKGSEGSILVMGADGNPTRFEEESALFRSIDEAFKLEYLDIYAPVSFSDERVKRKTLREWGKVVREIVEQTVRSKTAGEGGNR